MSEITRYASPYNWLALSARSAEKPASVAIHDLTLEGDGEEMAGAKLSEQDRIVIAERLVEIGVPRLSVLGNSPLPSDEDIRCAEKIIARDLPARLDAFVKTQNEIDIAKNVGLWGVEILVFVNEALLPRDKTGADIIDQCTSLSGYAKQQGLHTCLMAMDATRTKPDFLEKVIRAVDPYCDEITIADSKGIVSPYGLHFLLELVTQWTDKPLQVHLHNHTSMAVANALVAVLSGVSTIHTTVNGLGELTGLVALEEFAVASLMHLGVPTGVDLPGLKGLSDFVARATGLDLPLQKPVVGDAAFALPETEEIQEVYWNLYCEGRIEDGIVYPPRLVGNRYYMSIGRRCNAFTVLYNLAKLGWTADPEEISKIVAAVRKKMADCSGYALMSEEAFGDLVLKGGFELRQYERPAPAHREEAPMAVSP
jgi:isopropylmalate/homocitrate/citramalate synthase